MTLTTAFDKMILETLKRFKDTVEVYLVGGVVRDFFLNKESKDRDYLIIGMTLKEISNAISTIGTVTEVGKSFGIVTATIDGEQYDFAIPRKEISTGDSHTDFKVFTDNVSLLEDLKRRDFTMNSMAYNIETDLIIDPNHGLEDLKNGIIKFVGRDIDRFEEDPLRLLRMVQFSHRFQMNCEFDGTITTEDLKKLKTVSAERVFTEYEKAFYKGPQNVNKLISGIAADVYEVLFEKEPDSFILCETSQYGKEVPKQMWDKETSVITQLIRLFGENEAVFTNMKMPNKYVDYINLYKNIKSCRGSLNPKQFKNKSMVNTILKIATIRQWGISYIVNKIAASPMSIEELEVTGEDFLVLEIEPKKIGELVGQMIQKIFFGSMKNERSELLTFINKNKG